VDDEEHVTQLKLPPNVIHTPAGRSLADMMSDGDPASGRLSATEESLSIPKPVTIAFYARKQQ
jgi:hypothetical protein